MSDTTETYIKMSDCPEIQGLWIPTCGDFLCLKHPKDRRVVQIISSNPNIKAMHRAFYIVFPESYGGYTSDLKIQDNCIWLPHQDQLQEMVESENLLFKVKGFWEFCCSATFIKFRGYHSMEQLWLAFVMKEKFNKIWDGEKWVDNS